MGFKPQSHTHTLLFMSYKPQSHTHYYLWATSPNHIRIIIYELQAPITYELFFYIHFYGLQAPITRIMGCKPRASILFMGYKTQSQMNYYLWVTRPNYIRIIFLHTFLWAASPDHARIMGCKPRASTHCFFILI